MMYTQKAKFVHCIFTGNIDIIAKNIDQLKNKLPISILAKFTISNISKVNSTHKRYLLIIANKIIDVVDPENPKYWEKKYIKLFSTLLASIWHNILLQDDSQKYLKLCYEVPIKIENLYIYEFLNQSSCSNLKLFVDRCLFWRNEPNIILEKILNSRSKKHNVIKLVSYIFENYHVLVTKTQFRQLCLYDSVILIKYIKNYRHFLNKYFLITNNLHSLFDILYDNFEIFFDDLINATKRSDDLMVNIVFRKLLIRESITQENVFKKYPMLEFPYINEILKYR